MSNWNLRRQRIACAACGASFADGARYFSLLSTAAGEVARVDHCADCWARRDAAGSDLFWWRTRHTEQPRRGPALNLEALEALFVALEGRNDLRVKELRFLLCLLLMRKRRLKTVRMSRPEGSGALGAFVVRRPRRQEEFEVAVFEFQRERLSELREELRAIFAGGEAPPEGFPTGDAFLVASESDAPSRPVQPTP